MSASNISVEKVVYVPQFSPEEMPNTNPDGAFWKSPEHIAKDNLYLQNLYKSSGIPEENISFVVIKNPVQTRINGEETWNTGLKLKASQDEVGAMIHIITEEITRYSADSIPTITKFIVQNRLRLLKMHREKLLAYFEKLSKGLFNPFIKFAGGKILLKGKSQILLQRAINGFQSKDICFTWNICDENIQFCDYKRCDMEMKRFRTHIKSGDLACLEENHQNFSIQNLLTHEVDEFWTLVITITDDTDEIEPCPLHFSQDHEVRGIEYWFKTKRHRDIFFKILNGIKVVKRRIVIKDTIPDPAMLEKMEAELARALDEDDAAWTDEQSTTLPHTTIPDPDAIRTDYLPDVFPSYKRSKYSGNGRRNGRGGHYGFKTREARAHRRGFEEGTSHTAGRNVCFDDDIPRTPGSWRGRSHRPTK